MRNRILCAVDESPESSAAVGFATSLARAISAPLVLVHVIPAVQPNEGWIVLGPMAQGDVHELQARARDHADELLERLSGAREDTQTMLLVGDPSAAVLDQVAIEPASAIVVGARGHGRFGRAVLGSVSGRLAAQAPCPVIVVPHGGDEPAAREEGPIVCAIDGSGHAEAGAIVAAAAARLLGRDLILVHVLQAGLVLDEVAEREGWAFLTTAAERIDVPTRLIAEPQTATVTSTLAAIVARERAACLVVGSRGRGPVRSAVLGSVSTGVITEACCPVVVVPPNAQAALQTSGRPDAASAPRA